MEKKKKKAVSSGQGRCKRINARDDRQSCICHSLVSLQRGTNESRLLLCSYRTGVFLDKKANTETELATIYYCFVVADTTVLGVVVVGFPSGDDRVAAIVVVGRRGPIDDNAAVGTTTPP